MIFVEVNMNQETVRLMLTEELGMRKNLCQDGAQESYRATLGHVVEHSF
jgi:hypothetical protein